MVNAQPAPQPERYHPRVDADFTVQVLLPGRTVPVKARDLSMAGLFLNAHAPDSQRHLTLSIPLPGVGEITTRANIVRRETRGMALAFEELDWDDFLALARYLHPRLP